MNERVSVWKFDRLSSVARQSAESAAAAAGVPLGEWLTGLIRTQSAEVRAMAPPRQVPKSRMLRLELDELVPGRLGTRNAEDRGGIAALAAVLRQDGGVKRPLLVRPLLGPRERFEIVVGMRRWYAAREAGLPSVPALVTELEDSAGVLASLSENLSRPDFSVLEEGRAYVRLFTEFGLDIGVIAAVVGRDRTHLLASMRLLRLPAKFAVLIDRGLIDGNEAIALLEAADPERLSETLIERRAGTVEAGGLLEAESPVPVRRRVALS